MNSQAPPPGRILIVDDEVNIRRGLCSLLGKEGHLAQDVDGAQAALQALQTQPYDVAIVDIRMPGQSGISLLEEIRRRWPHVSVILLTGRATLTTAMAAVKAGAHDYLLKPASPEALRQAVSAGLDTSRRRQEREHFFRSLRLGLQRMDVYPAGGPPEAALEPQVILAGPLRIDLHTHEVFREGQRILLTPSEFNVLVTLASRPGQVISYQELVQQSLSYEAEPWEARELIKRHVFALRRKIEHDPSEPQLILNVRAVGYRLGVSPA